jgi:hypothetical protein
MPDDIRRMLRRLDRAKTEYGRDTAAGKIEMIRALADRRFARAAEVEQFHEALCFLRAYPDSRALLDLVEQVLAGFGDRADLRRHRDGLVNSGIAGTAVQFQFFPASALWLARHWGPWLSINWGEFEGAGKLETLLEQMALYAESPGLDEFAFDVREWIDLLKGPHETDAAFVLNRLAQLPMSPFALELLLEDLDTPFILSPGPDTPARSREKYPGVPVAYQTTPLRRARPDLHRDTEAPPGPARPVSVREARKLIDLSLGAMVVRCRDLNVFSHADERDVSLADCGDGLQFVLLGIKPQRRFLLETIYAFVMLNSGVPTGYGTHLMFMGSSEIAFTVFDTFRSGESAVMLERAVAIGRHHFSIDSFSLDPYQIGRDNEDAVQSGAWWFYQKLGFRPREAETLRLMKREVARQKADRAHRSSPDTLRKLAESNLHLHLDGPRDDVLGILSPGNVGLAVTTYVAKRFGSDRQRAEKECAQEAADLLGVRSMRAFSAGERLAWARWSPLVLVLPGVGRWSRHDQRALADVVRAKGGPRESEYLARFEGHQRLRRAILKLAQADG